MKCQYCGDSFISQRQHARYCKPEHRQAARRERNKRYDGHAKGTVTNKRFVKTCAYCRAEFSTNSPRARYCSDAHKQAAYRERRSRKK